MPKYIVEIPVKRAVGVMMYTVETASPEEAITAVRDGQGSFYTQLLTTESEGEAWTARVIPDEGFRLDPEEYQRILLQCLSNQAKE